MRHALLILMLCVFAVGCAYGKFIDQGDSLTAKGQYGSALTAYQNALREKPDSDEAKRKVHETKVSIMQQHKKVASARLESGDYMGAIAAAQQSRASAPDPNMAQGIVDMVGSRSIERATQYTNAGEFEESLRLLGALSASLDFKPQTVQPEIERVRQLWSSTLTKQAIASEGKGYTGDALLLYAQASSLTMKPSDVAKRDELYGTMLQTFAYKVYIKSKGALLPGMQFKARVASAEFEQNIVFVPSAKASHLNLTVTLGRAKISKKRTVRMDSEQYQNGTRLVPNPDYDRRRRDLEQQRRRVQDAQKRVQRANDDVQRAQDRVNNEGSTPNTTTSAESSLNSARNSLESANRNLNSAQKEANKDEQELYNTPQQKEEPTYARLEYPVETYTMRATMPYDLKGTHADKRPAIERELLLNVQKSDTTHAAYPLIKLNQDPLDLPSRDDMTSFLYKSAIVQTHNIAFESLTALRAELLKDALATPEPDKRIHKLVIYIMMDPINVSPDALSSISAIRGISDAPALLTKSSVEYN